MLKKLKKLLQRVIASRQQSAIEKFIISRNPTSVAEVEYWSRVFDRTGGRGYGQ